MPTPNLALRGIRENLGYSQEELSTRTGVSESMISRIESGARIGSASVLASLAEGLGVPAEAIGGISRPVAS